LGIGLPANWHWTNAEGLEVRTIYVKPSHATARTDIHLPSHILFGYRATLPHMR